MNRLFLLILLFCACREKNEKTSVSSSAPIFGQQIYIERCTSCHGSDGKLGFGGAKDLSVSSLDSLGVIRQVTEGKGAMTPFKNLLSPDEIRAVSIFSFSLRK